MRWKSLWCIHNRILLLINWWKILKIDPHLPKLLSNIKGYTLLWHSILSRQTEKPYVILRCSAVFLYVCCVSVGVFVCASVCVSVCLFVWDTSPPSPHRLWSYKIWWDRNMYIIIIIKTAIWIWLKFCTEIGHCTFVADAKESRQDSQELLLLLLRMNVIATL